MKSVPKTRYGLCISLLGMARVTLAPPGYCPSHTSQGLGMFSLAQKCSLCPTLEFKRPDVKSCLCHLQTPGKSIRMKLQFPHRQVEEDTTLTHKGFYNIKEVVRMAGTVWTTTIVVGVGTSQSGVPCRRRQNKGPGKSTLCFVWQNLCMVHSEK